MSETAAQFSIGSEVACSDGACGVVKRVVVDPVARVLTHLVVGSRHGLGLDHLVPIALASSAAGTITLACTATAFEALEEAQETKFLPGAAGQWSYGQEQMLSWPYYGLSMGIGGGAVPVPMPPTFTYDRVPVGEVDVRRGDHVHATDGNIGRVQGLVVDPGDHHVTHILLDEGHLWGHKRVAIPVGAVTDFSEGVRLRISKDDVRDLPLVELDSEG